MEMAPLQDAIDTQLAPSRIRSTVAGVYATVGLILAVAGVYGALRYVVAARLREMTIRMALGAAPARVIVTVFRYAATIVACGVAAGAGLAWWVLSISESLLFGVTAADPTSYLAAGSALMLGGVLASLGPARNLGRLDAQRLFNE
jgi:ABC-type antimicrobial peptide transport system permease subunit